MPNFRAESRKRHNLRHTSWHVWFRHGDLYRPFTFHFLFLTGNNGVRSKWLSRGFSLIDINAIACRCRCRIAKKQSLHDVSHAVLWIFLQTLYTYPQNFRAYKALIAAQYSGAQIKIADDFVFGETNKTEEFLKKFPLGKVSRTIFTTGKLCFTWSTVMFHYMRYS